jgi:hypothetical protein
MNPKPPPPRPSSSDTADFAREHEQPASPPTPSPDGPLEGLDPDGSGWGVRRGREPWDRLKTWLHRLTRREP